MLQLKYQHPWVDILVSLGNLFRPAQHRFLDTKHLHNVLYFDTQCLNSVLILYRVQMKKNVCIKKKCSQKSTSARRESNRRRANL